VIILRQLFLSFSVFVCSFLAVFALYSQNVRYAAQVTPLLSPPYSLVLSDYSDMGGSGLQADILFTDFNESQWDFRLRVHISSIDADIYLDTRPDFIPMQPITAVPGELMRLDAAEIAEYLNLRNLQVSGSGAGFLRSKGRLPEGTYRFCLELLDYQTGEVLSREACTTAWLQLANPPQLVSPICGEYVNPEIGFINFSWQLFNSISPNSIAQTRYQMRIWELLESLADPLNAVPNGQAVLVYQSDYLTESLFTYGPQELPLEDGKVYIYQVQAVDPDGRESYKNDGKSEFCYFYYGWPLGGLVDLIEPAENSTLRKDAVPKLKWSSPNNMISGQQVYYQVEVLEHNSNQSREGSLQQGRYVHYRETPPSFDRQPKLDTFSNVKPMQEYIWKISAFTGSQLVAQSPIGVFTGPVLMDHFYAGPHKVRVESLDSPDLRNASGKGSARLEGANSPWVNFEFSGLRLEKSGPYYYLREGEIIIRQSQQIELTPQDTVNHPASFAVSAYRLDKEGLSVKGEFAWLVPHPVEDSHLPFVKSKNQWLDYNSFSVFGAIRLGYSQNEYALLDPYGLSLKIDTSSYAYISQNRFRLNLNGHVSFQNPLDVYSAQVFLPFAAASDLYRMSYRAGKGRIEPFSLHKRMKLRSAPGSYIVDLSSFESFNPERYSNDWKGIIFQEFELQFGPRPSSQIPFHFTDGNSFDLTADDSLFLDWSSQGFSARINQADASLATSIYTFSGKLDSIRFKISDNDYQSECIVAGSFLIPFFSQQESFSYRMQINDAGLQSPILEGVQNRSFIHNKDAGDQQIDVYVHEAYFTGQDRINFILDIGWPAVDAKLERLRGFSCYGDYSIGFGTKNGTVPLTEHIPTEIKGYPANLVKIGAGSNEGYYALALQAEVTLTEDVSGDRGAPLANFYSLAANRFVDPNATGAIREISQETRIEDLIAEHRQEFGKLQNELEGKLKVESAAFTSAAQKAKSKYQKKTSGKQLASEDVDPLSKEESTAEVAGRFNEKQAEVVRKITSDMVSIVVSSIFRPINAKLDTINVFVEYQLGRAVIKADSLIENATRDIIIKLGERIAKRLDNGKVDLSGPINALAESTQQAIADELKNALTVAVAKNVLEPVTYLIQHDVKFQIQNHIIFHTSEGLFYQLDDQKQLSKQHFDSLYRDLPKVVEDAAGSVIDFASPDNIENIVVGLASDLITSIKVERIAERMRNSALQILKQEINGAISDAVADGLSRYGENIGIAPASGLPIDFVGVGTRLAQGDIRQLAFDPIHVKLKTAILELDGYIQYRPEDPTYGNIWMGDIDMKVSVPKPFALNAIYINGRKDDLSYWFVQISPPREGSAPPVSIGDPIPKGARPLPQPADMGIVKLVGAAGRLYHHMSEQPSGQILPDATMRYGAFMNLVFFDKSRDGEMLRLEVLGEINTRDNGDFTVTFDGNLQMENKEVSVLEPSERADIFGEVSIYYNSAERHFLGYARVVLNKPNTICAEGSLLVDLKPGKWRVALGSREERLVFVPGCVGWSPTGWLDLNQDEAELGIGLQWSIQHLLPSPQGLPVAAWFVRFNIDAGLAFGVMAAVQYDPLTLQRAGIWADLWAHIVMDYRMIGRSRWKSQTLVDILLKGDLVLHFAPKPTTLKGNLRGYISVLFFNREINAELEKVIS
jgi:hypothetical protein